MHAAPPPGPWAPESTLVYGADELGVSAIAAGLALRATGQFRWVDCARRGPVDDLPSHWIFARGSERPEVEEVDARVLEPVPPPLNALRRFVVPEGPEQEHRLESLLALPELFQRLGAPPAVPGATIVLANVDRLPPAARIQLMEQPTFHAQLHAAGLDLFATARDAPSVALSGAFGRVYRLEVPSGLSWSHGVVAIEKSPATSESTGERSVGELWAELGLDRTLLPPV